MKKTVFLSEIKSLSGSELRSKAEAIAEELLKLRFQQASGQNEQSHRFRALRRDLARIQTVISTQRNGASKAGAQVVASK